MGCRNCSDREECERNIMEMYASETDNIIPLAQKIRAVIGECCGEQDHKLVLFALLVELVTFARIVEAPASLIKMVINTLWRTLEVVRIVGNPVQTKHRCSGDLVN